MAKFVSPREAPQPPVGLEGYLSKQGGGSSTFGRRNWKVRYFTLKNGVLSYYADKKEAQANQPPKGSFHVLSITSIKTMPHKDKKFANQCHREIVLPNRSLVVCCDQEEILKKWVDAINSHIRYERKTEHLKKIQIEAQMVEEEFHQQMSFNIMYNVLKRWVHAEKQRLLNLWKMNMMIERCGVGPAQEWDTTQLRQKYEAEKKEEMKRFTEAVKEKWEDAVISLKEEMQAIKDENAKLHAENNVLREELGNSPAPSPEKKEHDPNIIEVQRSEFVELMEAAAINALGGSSPSVDTDTVVEMQSELASMEAELTFQRSAAATAQAQAVQQSQRADSMAARLEAAEDAMKKMSIELESLRASQHRRSISPPNHHVSPHQHQSPVQPTVSPDAALVSYEVQTISPSPATEGSSWIERYRKIVNSPI